MIQDQCSPITGTNGEHTFLLTTISRMTAVSLKLHFGSDRCNYPYRLLSGDNILLQRCNCDVRTGYSKESSPSFRKNVP